VSVENELDKNSVKSDKSALKIHIYYQVLRIVMGLA